MSRRAITALALALCACGGPGDPREDAGPPDDADAAPDARVPFEPAAPAPPALPGVEPCPEGWRAIPDDGTAPGLVRCDPWPETGHADCPDGQAHFPGRPGCEVVGAPCGEGDWATDLPADAEIVYVKAGAVGGNGLRGNPFGDLQNAVDIAASRGAVVALSKGTFDGLVFLSDPVTVWGACTAETILTRTEVLEYGYIVEVGYVGGSTVRNLSIIGDQQGVFAYELQSPLTLDAVIIRGKHIGVFADAGASIDATNLVVLETAGSDDGLAGYGVAALGGSHLSITRGLIVRSHTAGASVGEEGSDLVLRDTAILDTLPEVRTGDGGTGIEVRDGGRAVAERVTVDGARSTGIASLFDADLELTDVRVRDVIPTAAQGGYGIAVIGSRLVGRRIDVAASGWEGITIVEPGATAELEDVVVTDTDAVGNEAGIGGGAGLGIGMGAVVTVHRALVARSAGGGVVVSGEDSHLTAEDVTAFDTSSHAGVRGMALSLAAGATADVTRFHAARSTSTAVGVLGTLHLADALVEATAPGLTPSDGWGIASFQAGLVDLQRVVLRDLGGLGATAYQGGRLTGTDVLVEGIAPSSGAASGVISGEDGLVELTRFVVTRCGVCGVQVADSGAMDLHAGEIRGNPIGANVQDPSFDVARLQDGVLFLDNGTPLDTTSLPLPELGSGL